MLCNALETLSYELSNIGYGFHLFNKLINRLFHMDDLKVFAKHDNGLR